MKKALSTRSFLALAGVFFTLISGISGCKTSQQKKEVTKEDIGEEPAKEAVFEDLSGYPIPTSFEITELIHEAGAPYILTLSNDPDKAGDYIRQKDKALNLGVYGTDLCYASSYMMKQGTMLYLEASKTLIDELGIATNFHSDYVKRVESNLDDRDSLIMIVTDSFIETWDYLVENKEDVLARLVACGSWIEGIYITANIAQTSKDPSEILEILAEQKNSLDKLVKILEPVKDEGDVEEVFKGLFDLQVIYEGVGETLTGEQLDKISARIESMREAIV
jgi:hypothetical protein